MKKKTKDYSSITTSFKIYAGVGIIVVLIALIFLLPSFFHNTNLELVNGEQQTIKMTVDGSGYNPSSFAIREGNPTQFIIEGKEINGCSQYIVSEDFGFNQELKSGENIIKLPAMKKGTYKFHCGMNMLQGIISVVAENEPLTAQSPPPKSAGCGCKH